MPDDLVDPKWAVTERGKRIQYTEDDVLAAMRTLVLCGGRQKEASAQLREEGIPIKANALQAWRDKSFPRLYMQVRKDLGREVGEKVAGNALERALEADAAEQVYIQAAVDRIDDVEANHLAKNALALANAKSANIEKAQTLRHEPNEIVETRDIGDLVTVLERLGVAEKPDKPKQVKAEVEELTT